MICLSRQWCTNESPPIFVIPKPHFAIWNQKTQLAWLCSLASCVYAESLSICKHVSYSRISCAKIAGYQNLQLAMVLRRGYENCVDRITPQKNMNYTLRLVTGSNFCGLHVTNWCSVFSMRRRNINTLSLLCSFSSITNNHVPEIESCHKPSHVLRPRPTFPIRAMMSLFSNHSRSSCMFLPLTSVNNSEKFLTARFSCRFLTNSSSSRTMSGAEHFLSK